MIAPLWLGVVLLLLGSFVPGYLLSIIWSEDWTHGLEFGECLFVQLLSGLIFNSWLLLFLAELEIFFLPTLVVCWIAICALLAWMGRRRLRSCPFPRPRLSWWAIATAALLVLAGFLFAHPAESFLVVDDSGMYILSGIHLAKTGSLFTKDSILASLSPENAGEVLFTGPYSMNWSRFWGQFFTWGWGKPWVIFGLLDMQRLWCALFTLFLGTYGGLWVAPAFGVIATVGLCLLGRRLFSPSAGLLGALLLTLNFVQIWHARYPLSEMLAQAFVVGGFYLFVLFTQKRISWLGALAGLCLGGLFLARVDAILIGALFVGLTLYWRLSGLWKQEHAAFALTLGVALAYATLHNAVWGWAYLTTLWQIAGSPTLAKIFILGTLSLGALVLIALLKPGIAKAFLGWLSAHIWQILAGLVPALAVLIPLLHQALWGATWQGWALTWLVQYWTPLGIVLAAGGFILLLLRRSPQETLPFVMVALLYFALFSLNPMVNPVQPWAMRRFVPVILPALALLTAHTIATLPTLRFQLQRVVQGLAIAALIAASVRTDRPFVKYTEYSGLGQQLVQLANRFEENALILFDNGDPSLHLSQPLAYLHRLNTFILQKPNPDSSFIHRFVENWQQRGLPVYLALTGGSLNWHPAEWTFVPQGAFNLRLTRIQRSFNKPPTDIEGMNYVLDIYQIVPSNALPQENKRPVYLLNMEAGEYPYSRGGFYGLETTAEGLTFRWTDGVARLELPYMRGTDISLRLRVAGGRPFGVQEARLSILVNGTAVAQENLPAGFAFQTLEITLPQRVLHADRQGAVLVLQSNTWVPMAHGQGTDPRKLGVVVDWIEWRRAGTH